MITSSRTPRALTVVSLTALLALPACAQKLELDHGAATINSTGTHVAGGSTATYSGGAGAATSAYSEVDLSNAPNSPGDDTLTVQTGASIDTLLADSATATVTGGTVTNVTGQDNNILNVQGGTLTHIISKIGASANISGGTVEQVDAYQVGTANISGGTVKYANNYNDGEVFITGGTVSSTISIGEGGVFISGGTVDDAVASDDGGQFVSGGTIQKLETVNNGHSYISGGTVGEIDAVNFGAGDVHITGGSFQFIHTDTATYLTGTNLQATQTTGTGYLDLLLTGTLTNGDMVDAHYSTTGTDAVLFFNGHLATISPAPVPEASSVVSFGLLLALGAGCFARKTRNRVSAPKA